MDSRSARQNGAMLARWYAPVRHWLSGTLLGRLVRFVFSSVVGAAIAEPFLNAARHYYRSHNGNVILPGLGRVIVAFPTAYWVIGTGLILGSLYVWLGPLAFPWLRQPERRITAISATDKVPEPTDRATVVVRRKTFRQELFELAAEMKQAAADLSDRCSDVEAVNKLAENSLGKRYLSAKNRVIKIVDTQSVHWPAKIPNGRAWIVRAADSLEEATRVVPEDALADPDSMSAGSTAIKARGVRGLTLWRNRSAGYETFADIQDSEDANVGQNTAVRTVHAPSEENVSIRDSLTFAIKVEEFLKLRGIGRPDAKTVRPTRAQSFACCVKDGDGVMTGRRSKCSIKNMRIPHAPFTHDCDNSGVDRLGLNQCLSPR